MTAYTYTKNFFGFTKQKKYQDKKEISGFRSTRQICGKHGIRKKVMRLDGIFSKIEVIQDGQCDHLYCNRPQYYAQVFYQICLLFFKNEHHFR